MSDAVDGPLTLVACPDPLEREHLQDLLEAEGFTSVGTADAAGALRLLGMSHPELLVVDESLPNGESDGLMRRLRAGFRTAYTPVVLLRHRESAAARIERLLAGADDYVVRPFDDDEFLTRVRVTLKRSSTLMGLSPLTGLPGDNIVLQEIAARLRDAPAFACLYVDINNFHPFNERYGFGRGDQALRTMAGMLTDIAERNGGESVFVGHMGGDDFVVLCEPAHAIEVARLIRARSDADLAPLHDGADLARGFLSLKSRRGKRYRSPLLTVAIGIVFSWQQLFESPAAVTQAAAMMKGVAKRFDGSAFAVDHRQNRAASS
jgi:PleD family two-component response regulator